MRIEGSNYPMKQSDVREIWHKKKKETGNKNLTRLMSKRQLTQIFIKQNTQTCESLFNKLRNNNRPRLMPKITVNQLTVAAELQV